MIIPTMTLSINDEKLVKTTQKFTSSNYNWNISMGILHNMFWMKITKNLPNVRLNNDHGLI